MNVTLSFGEILADLRHERNMRQQDLALRLHVDRKTVSSYESGNSIPTIKNILKIAEIFDVSVDYLLGRTSVRMKWSAFEEPFVSGSSPTLGAVADEIDALGDKSKNSLLEYLRLLQISEKVDK